MRLEAREAKRRAAGMQKESELTGLLGGVQIGSG